MKQIDCFKMLIFFTIFITFISGAKASENQELDVEDLLYKGRLELTDNNPTAALEYFKKALDKCDPGSPQYNGRYGRCNFFIGEAYFQRFEAVKNVSDANAAIKYFEIVIDFGKKTTQDYPSLAKGRIRQIERVLSTIETGVSPETDRTFNVKTVPKGKIVANSWNLYVNGERIDNPFTMLLFIEDQSDDTPETLKKAVYISDAGAAEVAQRLGIQRFTQNDYTYNRDGILILTRTFRKPGYIDVVLKNGERFNNQWAIIEYDLNMPALPVILFEHFGAKVQSNWSERKVEINAPTDTPAVPAVTDWFILAEALKLPSKGDGGDWIIGFHDIQLPEKIYPGQNVQGRADIRIKENARQSSGAAIYISLYGDWQPDKELKSIYSGTIGEPRLISMPFSFTAPSKPGTYHLRFPMVLAFTPVKNYYGSKPAGQNDPGIGPFTEVSFVVSEQINTGKSEDINKLNIDSQGPIEAARSLIEAWFLKDSDKIIDVISDDILFFKPMSSTLGHGKYELKQFFSSIKKPIKISDLKFVEDKKNDNISRVTVSYYIEGRTDQSNQTLWFKKSNGNWLLFNPPLSVVGYSEKDAQNALKMLFEDLNSSEYLRYSNARLKKVIPDIFDPSILLMEINFDCALLETRNGKVEKSLNEDAAVRMKQSGTTWKSAGMYSDLQIMGGWEKIPSR
ncbi:MAG: hypothetical protein H8E17_15460 [Deltaproteobacteria bacterium]|nr:hypothetical protein [Deltaproteobacteria bacterium]